MPQIFAPQFPARFARLLLLPIAIFSPAALCAPAKPLARPAAKAAAKPRAPITDAAGLRVARALENVLRARVSSPGGALKIIITPTARSGEGFFSQIAIYGRPAQVRKLQISEFQMRARNVQIDVAALLNERRVRTLQSQTSLRAVVSEDDLTTLLARGKSTREMGLRVRYNADGTMNVTGTLHYALLNGPVSGTARLRVGADYKVSLDIISLKLRGAEVPGFVRSQLMGRINPVIDYEDVPFRPQFQGLSVVGTRAILKA